MMQKEKHWMIYGANGYTGELIARKACELGLQPTIAGRNREKIVQLASELKLPFDVFPLKDVNKIASRLKGMNCVLHCAGPFTETSEVMARACLKSHTHYLDITGEIPVYSLLYDLHNEAKSADVMLLPGVGFDIVPTDCIAAKLSKKMLDAKFLSLAFMGLAGVSRGTLKSMLAQAPDGSKMRKNGEIISIPQFSKSKMIEYKGKQLKFHAIPWGDVFTAYHSTKIPNIEVYSFFPGLFTNALQFLGSTVGLFKVPPLLHFSQFLVDQFVTGPSELARQTDKCYLWGEVQNEAGDKLEIRYETEEGYQFTVDSSILAVLEVLKGNYMSGFQTPSLVLGNDFIDKIPGSIQKE
ncbi:MAG: saccharopine dehydrogenase NADP-binding domain-containing protein [Leptospiraceae bacterium]|nr:saccharopine dehydrogenase NADP-binding domain-containing protein [Leptospiraceae bacterium]